MRELRKIVDMEIVGDFVVRTTMRDGDVFDYDMSFVHQKDGPLFVRLRDAEFFRKAWVEDGALEWPHGFGIHGETIARDGTLVRQEEAA